MGGGVHMPPAAWGVRPGGWGRGGGGCPAVSGTWALQSAERGGCGREGARGGEGSLELPGLGHLPA